MKPHLIKRISRFKNLNRKLFRKTRYELNSMYTTYLLALILGATLATSTLVILPTLGYLYLLRLKTRSVLLISIILFITGVGFTTLFVYNLANLDTNSKTTDLIIVSKYQDYYEGYNLHSNTYVQIYTEEELNIFSNVRLHGDLKISKTNPYYSISRNTPFNINPEEVEIMSNGIPLIMQIKEYILDNLNYNLSREASDFSKSLIFGDSSFVDKEVKEDFRQIGILHVIALSGYNFILILNLGNSCLFFIDKRKRGLITIPIGVIYLLIAGLTNLSGLRALIFFILNTLLSYFGIYVSRTKLILTTIVFFLMLNPMNIYSFSLVLSYSAYFGIILASKIKGPKIKKLVFEQVLVSLFTLPTLALIASSFNVLSLVINILLSPIVSLVSVILVVAQILTPILTFCSIIIELLLKVTSRLSEMSLQVSAIVYLSSLLLIVYIINKITNLIKV